ncbi:hypothetical protein [Alicyclobacillus fastidiosus]|uniref:Uncharacterized protein n=1 Tax=Alicyclobacillus fastidiosus TaxID=392011 RepID=A0ABV5ADJ1_9BACL|nr:hypothetical protein [Alicyclobacillus fastidiosus]WEH08630.1 hypothetical protein PYS47_18355 [Alicyclobacillus fastidiosus]
MQEPFPVRESPCRGIVVVLPDESVTAALVGAVDPRPESAWQRLDPLSVWYERAFFYDRLHDWRCQYNAETWKFYDAIRLEGGVWEVCHAVLSWSQILAQADEYHGTRRNVAHRGLDAQSLFAANTRYPSQAGPQSMPLSRN